VLFNLIPVPPLDGHRILGDFFPGFRRLWESEQGAMMGLFAFMAIFFFGAQYIWDAVFAVTYTTLDAALGLAQTSIVGLAVAEGDVFTPDALARIRRIAEAVEGLPGVVPGSVLSLASPSAKGITADGDLVRVAPLVPEDIPSDPAALRALRERALAHPMYVGTIVAADARGAMVLADFTDHESAERITEGLEAIAARERAPGVEVWVGGQSPALAALNGATYGIVPLVALALVVIAIVHYEAFRTLQAVFLPLVTAGLSRR